MLSYAQPSSDPLAEQGDFETLFRQLYPRLFGLVYRVAGEREAAEDILQEAFLRLSRSRMQTQPAQEAAAWLRRVCLNLAINWLRDDRRWRARLEMATSSTELDCMEPDGPSQALLAQEERRAVREVLSRLSQRQRDCLLLRYSGYSYAEVATTLEIAPGSVSVLLARAERAFGEIFRELHHDLS